MSGIMTVQVPDIDKYVKELVRQAYELGVEEGRKKYSYPPLLTRKDLAEIFQVQLSTVSNLTDIPDFPKFEHIRARYPRDQVFRWIEENSTYLQVAPNRKFGKRGDRKCKSCLTITATSAKRTLT